MELIVTLTVLVVVGAIVYGLLKRVFYKVPDQPTVELQAAERDRLAKQRGTTAVATQSAAVATIQEHTQRTPEGNFCLILLLLNAAITIIAFLAESSAVRQAAYGTMLTGGSVLFGLGVVLGRTRTYIVFRDKPDDLKIGL
jgi:hypothetical protein